ncbi:MAG: hypothetical protein IKQ35_00835 [Bacilli bacterium]|nr:hypothetical protein [Bacilli bacterium]
METLEQYLSYEKNPENIRTRFIEIDDVLETFHKKGYKVDVRPSKIVYSDGVFVFSNFYEGIDDAERRKEITDLAKLAVGTYYSLPSGQFIDYTKVSTEYLRQNYDALQMDDSILKASDDDTYYHDVIVDGKDGVYYNNYLIALRESQSRNRTNTKTVVKSLGTLEKPNSTKEAPEVAIPKSVLDSNKKQAAFIDIVFYPILLAIFAMVGYAISVIIRVL